MRIIEVKDYDELSRVAANIIAAQMVMKPDSVLGLATGSTPVGAYERLAELNKAGDIDFSEITTINLDEYKGLSHEHDQGYYYFMNENLYSKVNLPLSQVNVPNGLEDADQACPAYDKLIEEKGGIDLQLLGLGQNGHVGFNEPGDEFIKETHEVILTENTRQANARFFASIDEVPTAAYTMGIEAIMKAKKVLVVVNGKNKAKAVYDSFFGPITPQVQASILQLHPDCTVVVDEEAMSLVHEMIKQV